MSKCIGCGVKIQTEDPKKIGYVPEIKLIEDGEEVYCKRCYDIMHHNARYDYSTSTENYYKKISGIKNTNSLIIFAAIDNLIKGAAGQAIQNLNIMYGLPENTGLDFVPTCI